MRQCDYYFEDEESGYQITCDREVWQEDDKCLFHSSNPAKKDLFEEQLKIKTEPDYEGFFFPVALTEDLLSPEVKVLIGLTEYDQASDQSASFKAADFHEGIDLGYVNFLKPVDMSYCIIRKNADFKRARFEEGLIMTGSEIQAALHVRGSKLFFNNVILDAPEKVRLDKINLADCPLAGTAGLSNVILHEPIRPGENKQFMIYDDTTVRKKILAGHKISTQEFEETIELYRQLRINFEKRLMYPEAGEFHIGEMGARKLAISNDMSKKRFVRRIEGAIFHIYKWISLYGESYIRPFACIMGLVSLCAILYGFSGVKSGNTEIKYVFTLQHFQCKNCFEFFSELWIYS